MRSEVLTRLEIIALISIMAFFLNGCHRTDASAVKKANEPPDTEFVAGMKKLIKADAKKKPSEVNLDMSAYALRFLPLGTDLNDAIRFLRNSRFGTTGPHEEFNPSDNTIADFMYLGDGVFIKPYIHVIIVITPDNAESGSVIKQVKAFSKIDI
jgi:hypothetical protein